MCKWRDAIPGVPLGGCSISSVHLFCHYTPTPRLGTKVRTDNPISEGNNTNICPKKWLDDISEKKRTKLLYVISTVA